MLASARAASSMERTCTKARRIATSNGPPGVFLHYVARDRVDTLGEPRFLDELRGDGSDGGKVRHGRAKAGKRPAHVYRYPCRAAARVEEVAIAGEVEVAAELAGGGTGGRIESPKEGAKRVRRHGREIVFGLWGAGPDRVGRPQGGAPEVRVHLVVAPEVVPRPANEKALRLRGIGEASFLHGQETGSASA